MEGKKYKTFMYVVEVEEGMKISKCPFIFAVNNDPTLFGFSVQVSPSSKLYCVCVNDTGKLTMVKLLIGKIKA